MPSIEDNLADYMPERWEFTATITHDEIVAFSWVRRMNDRIARKHPVQTKQAFDFRQNLLAYL